MGTEIWTNISCRIWSTACCSTQQYRFNPFFIFHIKNFVRTKPFSVIQCDKNIGSAIVSNDLLKKLCNDHLMDDKIYMRLKNNPLNCTVDKIKTILTNSINEGLLNIDIKLLLTQNCKLGKFRILCKLHKTKFGIRPIINSKQHPTSKLCKLIDLIIKPILSKTPTYLKDSQHLLQMCNKLEITSNNVFLYSMDFESLYTNLDKFNVCKKLTEFVAPYLDYNYIKPEAFYNILMVVFENNVFIYDTNYYVQSNGLAMGCICGPSVASLYVFILEKHWLSINKPLFYGRFIDDICLISDESLDEEVFQKQFLNLKLSIVTESSINFLDLVISFDKVTKKLNFSLFIKPTNTFSYLLVNSNHPEFVFKNIPKALFIRVKRICTSYTDYLFYTRKLILQLVERGYDFDILCALQRTLGNIPRDNLLSYKKKDNFLKNHNQFIFFGSEFNRSFNNKNNIFDKSLVQTKNSINWLENYKFKFYFLISPNLFSIFIHNKRLENNTCHTKKCLAINCSTCSYINSNSYIFLKNGFIIPIKDNCNCASTNVIYIIRCLFCDVFYVGQTKRSASARLKEHIKDIKKFVPFINLTSEVGFHFNLRNHNYKNHLQFYIFKKDVLNLEDRLSIETDIIHLIKENNPPIINQIIPSKSKIGFLSFL